MRVSPRLATPLCVAFLFALPFVLFAPVTLGDRTLIPADILFQFEPFASSAFASSAFASSAPAVAAVGPHNGLLADLVLENFAWKKFALDSLQHGELPLWNPNLFAGVPFLAAGQHSMLYPPSWLALALPLAKAYGWYTVLNLALAGVFMFVFARTLGLRRSASLFAAVAYEFSGFMVVSVVFQMIIGAAAWLPLILAMCERVIRQSPALRGRAASAPWAIVGAFAVGMSILAGHVEITVYTALVTGAYCAWQLVFGWRRTETERGRWLAARVGWLAVIAVLGAGLGAIQLAPLVELVTRNFRSGSAPLSEILTYGFPPREALNFIMPNFFGSPAEHGYFDVFTLAWQPLAAGASTHWGVKNYVEGGAYVGVVTLILAGYAVVRWLVAGLRSRDNVRQRARSLASSTPPTGFFVVLAFFSLAFIFGTPLYAILYYGLPGINQLHSPFRWIFPLTLCLATLGGLGLHQLLARAEAPGAQRPSRVVKVSAWLGIGVGAILLAGLVVARLMWSAARPLLDNAVQRLLYADRAFTSAEMFFSYEARNVALFALVLIASCGLILLVVSRSRGSRVARAAPLLIVGLLALDLTLAWTGFNPADDPKLLEVVPEAVKFLKRDQSQWRMTSYSPTGARPLHANTPWLFNIQDVRGYDSIIPKQYVDYMRLIEPQNELLYNRIAPLSQRASLESPLLDLLGVKYVVTQDTIDTPGFSQAFDDGRTRIYRNERALPRAFTLPQDSALLTANFAGSVQVNNPTQFVMIDASCGITDTGCVVPRAGKAVPANVTSYKNNEVWIDAQIDTPSWLVLTDSYFPGWRAWVRPLGAPDSAEREVQIGLVNGNFRAVKLDLPNAPSPVPSAQSPFQPANPQSSLGSAQTPAAQPPAAFTVRFKYSPDSVRVGAFASIVALATLIFIGSVYVWRTLATSAANEASGVRRVFKNSLMLTAVNIGARLIDFAFATLMLRVLGPAGAGNYAYAVVIVSWFEIFMNFGLNTYLTREVSRDKSHGERYFFSTSSLRLMLAMLAMPAVLIVIALSGGGEVGAAILLLALSQLPSSLSTGISALFFAHERAEVPAAITLVTALLKVVFGTLALMAGLGIVGLAGASIVVNVITLAVLVLAARNVLGVRFNMAAFRAPTQAGRGASRPAMMRESFPLMLNHLLATLFFKVDVPLLHALQGPEVVGWYSTAYKFVDAFNIIPAFFTQSLFPSMSRMAAGRDNTSRALAPTPTADPFARSYLLAVKLLVMTALPLAVFTTFAAEWMVGVLGGREYLPAGATALTIMIWSIPFGWVNSVTNYALIAVGQQRALTRAFVIGLTFNVVANLLLIPIFSYQAAAFVTILSEIVEGSAFYFYVRRHISKVNWFSLAARPVFAAAVMAAVVVAFRAAGWHAVGMALGVLAYLATLAVTRALTPGEWTILAPLLPARLKQRLSLAQPG